MNDNPYLQYNMQNMISSSFNQPEMADMNTYRMVYPEIFYKLQPYIMSVCDQMDTCGYTMPTQEMMNQMCDNIYDDVCCMYPDIEEYARNCENNVNTDSAVKDVISRRPGFYRRSRRRGLLRDLIEILLLSEIFRRRRRYY